MFVFESSDSSWDGKLPHALQYSLGPGSFSLETLLLSAGYTRHTCPRANFYVEHLGPGGMSPEASCRLPPPPALPPQKEAAMPAPWTGKWGFSNPSFHEVYTGLYVGSGFCLVPAGHLKPRPWVSKCHFHFSILPELRSIALVLPTLSPVLSSSLIPVDFPF